MAVNFTAAVALNMNAPLFGLNFLTDTFDSDTIANDDKDVSDTTVVWRATATLTIIFTGSINHTFDNVNDATSTVTAMSVQQSGVTQYVMTNFAKSFENIGDLNPIAPFLSANTNVNGSAGSDLLNGYAGNDTINGNGGNDTLNGGANEDILNGAAGTDVLVGGTEGDLLNGGAAGDTLRGEGGNDRLIGGPGADNMFGGTGSDKFVLSGAISANDRIQDFNTNLDKIQLDHELFAGLGPVNHALAAAKFHIGNNATTPGQRIIYDPDSTNTVGIVFFDSNGSGAGGKQAIARLDDGLAVHASNFFVI